MEGKRVITPRGGAPTLKGQGCSSEIGEFEKKKPKGHQGPALWVWLECFFILPPPFPKPPHPILKQQTPNSKTTHDLLSFSSAY